MLTRFLLQTGLALTLFGSACAGPSAGNMCQQDADCPEKQQCLTQFKGGYCGIKDCSSDEDCPQDTFCVQYEGSNFCFLMCKEKIDCNANRSVELESNCSSNIVAVDDNNSKACVPPSGE
jgi:hypothetical protein